MRQPSLPAPQGTPLRPVKRHLIDRRLLAAVVATCIGAAGLPPQAGGQEGNSALVPAHEAKVSGPRKEYSALQAPGGGGGALNRTLSGFLDHVEGGAITLRKSTPTKCLPGDLKMVLAEVAQRFGKVSVQSTHRSPQRNRRAGGARRSLHLECRAIDFRVKARGRDVLAYLRKHEAIGGLKQYRNGIIHIDNGQRRSW